MFLLIVYLLIALVFSFFCSIAEAVLLSVRPAYINALEKENPKGAKILHDLKNNIDRPLAAILSLNTVAHTVGAAGVGAQSAFVFGSAYLGLTSAVLTLLILVLSEIIPKSLGATYWHKLATIIAPYILLLTNILTPFVWMSELITDLFSPGGKTISIFSRDELKALAEMGAEEGYIDVKELNIVNNLMRLRELTVRDIMTPRPVIFMVSADMTVGEYFHLHANNTFSRIAIYGENREDIISYVLKVDILLAQANDEFDRKLIEFKRPFHALPNFVKVSEVFDHLTKERTNFVFIVDEYGTVQGLVTMEDVLETLTGLEISDELDSIESMQNLARQRWRERITQHGIDPSILDDRPTE